MTKKKLQKMAGVSGLVNDPVEAIHSIDEVIAALENIIASSKANDNPLGYFAVLYQKVTVKVKEGMEQHFFEDGERMEQLDVVFAKRYLTAYFDYQKKEPISHSWKRAFDLSENYWPIVLQHLLMGINAHINLDLGIAAATISKGKNIGELKGDFDKINEVLSALVNEVQEDLVKIWPTLNWVLKKTKGTDDFLVDFSMTLARDGAWQFAQSLAHTNPDDWEQAITLRDQKVVEKTKLILPSGWLPKVALGIVRIGERGSVAEKMKQLKSHTEV